MLRPSNEPGHGLATLLAALGRAARFGIAAQPDDRDEPVTTSAVWACGCRASGPSYRELRLTACPAHLALTGGIG
jgi:hypothetical protein